MALREFAVAQSQKFRPLVRKSMVRAGYHTRPSFLIIGAQKSGTTALHAYLTCHPQVVGPRTKELHFFDREYAYRQGLGWYHEQFPLPHQMKGNKVTFEASPSYLYLPQVPDRIHAYDRDMPMIVLLRDPVLRAYSAWNMFKQLFANDRTVLLNIASTTDAPFPEWVGRMSLLPSFPSFDEMVSEELDAIHSNRIQPFPDFVRRGCYHEQLARYFNRFSPRQILLIDSHMMRGETTVMLTKITDFLGLRRHDWDTHGLPLVGKREYEKGMSAETERLLRSFYEPHNQKLQALLGMPLFTKTGHENDSPGITAGV